MDDEVKDNLRRNFTLGVLNGLFFMAGARLLSPEVTLPQFLRTLFESKAAVGIGSNLGRLGWCIPQVAVAYFLRSLSRRKVVYVVGNWSRMALIGLFILSFYLLQGNRQAVGVFFFIFFGLSALVAGVVGLAFQDIVARMIPSWRRGSFNAFRAFFGQGLLALAGAQFLGYVLDNPETFPYPGNFLLIFLVAWGMMILGVIAFSNVKEPPERETRPLPKAKWYLFELFLSVKRDHNFRRYLIIKGIRHGELLAISYYIVYATDRLGLPEAMGGTYLTVTVLTTVLGAVLWGRISDRRGNRLVIIGSSVAAAAAPFLGLAIVVLTATGFFEAQTFHLAAGGVDVEISRNAAATWMLAPAFALLALGRVGRFVGFQNYIMDAAPARRRPLYLGLSTTVEGLLLLALPALGGAIIDVVEPFSADAGFGATFALAGVLVGVSAVLSRRLYEPREAMEAR